MFFKKKAIPLLNNKAYSYIGQIGTISRKTCNRKGKVKFDDQSVWYVHCDYDCDINVMVLIVDVIEKMDLKAQPVNKDNW